MIRIPIRVLEAERRWAEYCSLCGGFKRSTLLPRGSVLACNFARCAIHVVPGANDIMTDALRHELFPLNGLSISFEAHRLLVTLGDEVVAFREPFICQFR